MLTIYAGNDSRKNKQAVTFYENKKTPFVIKKLKKALDEDLLNKLMELVEGDYSQLVKDSQKDFSDVIVFKKTALENPNILKAPIFVDWEKPEKGILLGFTSENATLFVSKEQRDLERKRIMQQIQENELADLQKFKVPM